MPLVEDKIDVEKGTESRGNGVRKRQIFGEDQMRKLGAVSLAKRRNGISFGFPRR
jgi:hypothetical protein